ncbi:MAG: TatD family hydrolase, partial [Clostridia bacterium]
NKYPFIYAAIGVHPYDTNIITTADIKTLKELALNKKVVAIGEIGLDYFYDLSPRDVQKARFRDQLILARALALPVIIHDRDAHEDCLNILRDFTDLRVVYHCYSGSLEYAKVLIGLGFYLSFTGSITFKNAKSAPSVIEWMPRERLMIETDSPYLTPVPHRGKRNDPSFVPLVAAKISELLSCDLSEVAAFTMENGNRFFKIV